ncbi:hypothetical protein VaNZ11_009491 [Volvox africanus]|uniref:Methyltransferase type 12 domain-containing protein n=1 Tax=Volvox africanus TaxID=51714 RepID=A0ABQ5S7I0_9CHLO|nr:hypothetical protein VaNZ11_009491 [Volvox africanus]
MQLVHRTSLPSRSHPLVPTPPLHTHFRRLGPVQAGFCPSFSCYCFLVFLAPAPYYPVLYFFSSPCCLTNLHRPVYAPTDRYEAQAGRYWDLFYRRNATKFFKDRHYLHKEFPALARGPATLLEVGCGVGNTVFPLLEINPALKIYCCDFAPSAIELVRQNPMYKASGGAVEAFVADITSDFLAAPQSEGGCGVPDSGCDLATMIFVLSAIHPQRMAAAIHNVARCLRPGSGRLLFRDYAEGDLAQERLAGGDRPKRLGPNFYVRGDGTRCYYFTQPEVLSLFMAAGFTCDSVTLHERTVVNHKRDIAMDRRWLQAIFTLRQYQPPPIPLKELLGQPAPSYTHQQPHQHNEQRHAELAAEAPRWAGRGGDAASNGDVNSKSSGMDVDANVHPLTTALAAALPSLGGGTAGVASGLYTGSWLTGAAGRLASHLAAGPGQPSGRALLPETLDSAEDLRAQLSPYNQLNYLKRHQHSPRHHLEGQLRSQDIEVSGGSSRICDGVAEGGMGQIHVDGGGSAPMEGLECRQGKSRGGGSSEDAFGNEDGGGMSLESELEAEFFATIGRDSAEVVAEEVAATGAALSRVRLADVAEIATAHHLRKPQAAPESSAFGSGGGGGGGGGLCSGGLQQSAATPHHPSGPPSGLTPHLLDIEVPVAVGVSFRCLLNAPQLLPTGVSPATMALARILLASSRMLAGRCALQLGPARLAAAAVEPSLLSASVLPAMAAVRGSARRVVVSEAGRERLAAAAADLRQNAHLVVIERLRLMLLDWAAAPPDGGSVATAAVTGAAGYTYVQGAVRQIRDILQINPTGYDLVYAADPLSDVTAAFVNAAGTHGSVPIGTITGEVAIEAARGLFNIAGQLVAGGRGTQTPGAAAPEAQLLYGAAERQGLLLLCVPGAWAATHGVGFAALAAVCGWELLVPEQLAELYGADVAAAADLGCTALAFRKRAGTSAATA